MIVQFCILIGSAFAVALSMMVLEKILWCIPAVRKFIKEA